MRSAIVVSALALAGAACNSNLGLETGRLYACDRDGGSAASVAAQCPGGFVCGLEAYCHSPDAGAPWLCEGDVDCVFPWRCGKPFDAGLSRCQDPSVGAAYACDPRDDTFCEQGWRCGLSGTCHPVDAGVAWACLDSLDCDPGWRCGLRVDGGPGRCQDTTVAAPYPCVAGDDFFCEQGWRCGPEAVCLDPSFDALGTLSQRAAVVERLSPTRSFAGAAVDLVEVLDPSRGFGANAAVSGFGLAAAVDGGVLHMVVPQPSTASTPQPIRTSVSRFVPSPPVSALTASDTACWFHDGSQTKEVAFAPAGGGFAAVTPRVLSGFPGFTPSLMRAGGIGRDRSLWASNGTQISGWSLSAGTSLGPPTSPGPGAQVRELATVVPGSTMVSSAVTDPLWILAATSQGLSLAVLSDGGLPPGPDGGVWRHVPSRLASADAVVGTFGQLVGPSGSSAAWVFVLGRDCASNLTVEGLQVVYSDPSGNLPAPSPDHACRVQCPPGSTVGRLWTRGSTLAPGSTKGLESVQVSCVFPADGGETIVPVMVNVGSDYPCALPTGPACPADAGCFAVDGCSGPPAAALPADVTHLVRTGPADAFADALGALHTPAVAPVAPSTLPLAQLPLLAVGTGGGLFAVAPAPVTSAGYATGLGQTWSLAPEGPGFLPRAPLWVVPGASFEGRPDWWLVQTAPPPNGQVVVVDDVEAAHVVAQLPVIQDLTRGPFQAVARPASGGSTVLTVTAFDSLLFGTQVPDAGTPTLTVRVVPLSRQAITSLAVVDAAAAADAGSPFLHEGYLVASGRLFRYVAPNEVVWRTEEIVLPGEAVFAWTEGRAGRAAMRDGSVYGLSTRVQLASALPGGAVARAYATVRDQVFVHSTAGLFRLEHASGATLGTWVEEHRLDAAFPEGAGFWRGNVLMRGVASELQVFTERGSSARLTFQ